MKNLSFLYFTLLILSYGCTNKATNQKPDLMQICLDALCKNKDFKYLEKSPLILIENQYSKDLGDIHFGRNKVVFRNMSLPEQHAVLGKLTDKGPNYFKIDDFKVENDKAEVILDLPLLTLQIPLKKGKEWVAQGISVITGDNILLPHPQKRKLNH